MMRNENGKDMIMARGMCNICILLDNASFARLFPYVLEKLLIGVAIHDFKLTLLLSINTKATATVTVLGYAFFVIFRYIIFFYCIIVNTS